MFEQIQVLYSTPLRLLKIKPHISYIRLMTALDHSESAISCSETQLIVAGFMLAVPKAALVILSVAPRSLQIRST